MSILLIEDDLSLARGLEYTLKKEGFDVDSAATAAKGTSLFHLKDYRLILLDVNLSDGNGFDLFRTFRKASETPVIFLTACDEEVNVVMGLDMGADDYISKPFRINELVSRIKAVLRRTPAEHDNPQIIHAGEISLDKDSSRVRKKELDVQLTATEFRLVNLLLTNKNIIVTREKLMEQIWDSGEHFVEANTLSVYIRRLREKLEDDPAKPDYIETVRGVGYRWKS